MSEHTHPDGRPRSSPAAAAAALSRLGRLRDLPVIVMLVWTGWLAVPWPAGGPGQTREASVTEASGTAAATASGTGGGAVTGTGCGAAVAEAVHRGPLTGAGRPPVGGPEPAGLHGAADVQELIAAERARIAGEVHDAAGHGLAAIAMQAGIALLMLDEDPGRVRESLEAIRSTSTQALGQLRAALDRIDPAAPDHDLPRLIDGVRAAGLAVDVEPAEPVVPAHLEGTVYRVVRESLTNVLRHAGPARAVVRLAGGPGEFVVEVADRGTGVPGNTVSSGAVSPGVSSPGSPDAVSVNGAPGTAAGRGLAGIRARVAEAGGVFSAGPREDGGFRVRARFPVDTA
ncbi:sensor histidine kinase [Planobispora rosea]|uniref:sensor histidine kinase n=1 Tax=Planobispora rosea TaxID=35762 RepID=UPI00083B7F76|nr:histidine kinase [Planobispora rosea]